MDAIARRRLTDAVTLSRIPIAAGMLAAHGHRAIVTSLFVVGALTDIVDGPLARRLGTASDRGARLDSVADALFVVAAVAVVASTIDGGDVAFVTAGIAVVTLTRLVTLAVTRRRFGVWSIMHTWLNKASGFGLAVVATTALAAGELPVLPLAVVAAVAELAAIEELAIVVGATEYDRDRSSLLRST